MAGCISTCSNGVSLAGLRRPPIWNDDVRCQVGSGRKLVPVRLVLVLMRLVVWQDSDTASVSALYDRNSLTITIWTKVVN